MGNNRWPPGLYHCQQLAVDPFSILWGRTRPLYMGSICAMFLIILSFIFSCFYLEAQFFCASLRKLHELCCVMGDITVNRSGGRVQLQYRIKPSQLSALGTPLDRWVPWEAWRTYIVVMQMSYQVARVPGMNSTKRTLKDTVPLEWLFFLLKQTFCISECKTRTPVQSFLFLGNDANLLIIEIQCVFSLQYYFTTGSYQSKKRDLSFGGAAWPVHLRVYACTPSSALIPTDKGL